MRKLLVSLLLAFVIPAAAQDENNGLYTLKSGNVTMTIDAAKGGKILSFKYGDQEVISQLKWPESFGSTFWTSPQKEWYWPPVPEYDKKPYAVEEKDGVLTMTSEVNDKLKYRIRKAFAVDEQNQAIAITYSIINESDETRKVAPWEITRVQNEGGLIFFEAPVDSIWPAGLMNFKDANGIACYEPDEANDNRKVNADGKGWLAYLNKEKGLLLVKQFEDLATGQPAPDEAEIQVYVNRGKTYIELESQGAYTTLKPKEQVCWTVRWNLLPCEGTPTLSDALLQKIRNLKSSN
jgi:hypothetical protein